MAKTKKTAEKKPEVMELRRSTRKKANRPSIVLPVENSKKKTEASAAGTTKTRAKKKEKNAPPAPKASKKQPKAAVELNERKKINQKNSKNIPSGHGDLLVNMKPVTVKLRRIFTKAGQLPRNMLTSIIQRDWHKHIYDEAKNRTNNSLKGIEFHPFQTLRLHEKCGVAFALYKTKHEDNIRVGVLIIEAGNEKKSQITGQHIRFTVLCGSANFVSPGICEHYKSGSVFTVPPKVRYRIKNVSASPCYLNFFSYGQLHS